MIFHSAGLDNCFCITILYYISSFFLTWWPSSVGPSETLWVLSTEPDSESANCCPWRPGGRRPHRPPRWSPSSGWRASGGCAASPADSSSLSSCRGERLCYSVADLYLCGIVFRLLEAMLLRGSISSSEKRDTSFFDLATVFVSLNPLGAAHASRTTINCSLAQRLVTFAWDHETF